MSVLNSLILRSLPVCVPVVLSLLLLLFLDAQVITRSGILFYFFVSKLHLVHLFLLVSLLLVLYPCYKRVVTHHGDCRMTTNWLKFCYWSSTPSTRMVLLIKVTAGRQTNWLHCNQNARDIPLLIYFFKEFARLPILQRVRPTNTSAPSTLI